MGNDPSTHQAESSPETFLFANFLQSYQPYHHPEYPFIKNFSHGGKLTLFKKLRSNPNLRNNQQKELIILNHQSLFKPKTVPEIDNFKSLIAYYNKRLQVTNQNETHDSQTESNIIKLLHFSIKNETTNEFIYPQNTSYKKNEVIKPNLTNVSHCGFKQIFRQEQKEPSINYLKRNLYSISFLQEFYGDSLEKEIKFRAENGEYFREKEIWSIVYCCCKAAEKMLTGGLKEPVLSTRAIFITEDCEIKVGEWEFINYYFSNEESQMASNFEEEGETFVSNDLEMTLNNQNNKENQDILTKFYWPPEGLIEIQNILRLGEVETNKEKLSEAKNSQVFCLGMTILQMLTLKPYYQKATYSEKQLTKLIEEAVEIRQSEFEPMSQEMVDLLLEMLQWDPAERFRFEDIIEYIHQVFETNEAIFRESITVEGKSSRMNNISDLSNCSKTNRRETGSLETEISIDPFYLKQKESIYNEETHREEGYIKNINFTVSLENSDEIKEKEGLIKGMQKKKGSLLDSGVINQGTGDDYNPDSSDEYEEGDNHYEKLSRNPNIKNTVKKLILSPMRPDHPDLLQEAKYQMEEIEENETPDEDVDYEPAETSENFYNNNFSESKEILEKPFTLIESTSPFTNFTINHYVSMDWKQQNSNFSGHEKSPSLNESLDSMKSFNLKFLNRSNEEYNMKKNIKIEESPQFSIKPLEIKEFNNLIKETTSPFPSAKLENKEDSLYKKYESHENENLFTSPNIMEMIREFTKKESQQTPDFQNIQLPSVKPTFNETNSELSKKLSFKESSLEKEIAFKTFGDNFSSQGSEFFSSSKELIEAKLAQSDEKNEVISREQFAKGWYEGALKNGIKNGYGTYYYNEGGKYSGYWYNNKMDGHGTLYYSDGRVAYEGQWQNDSLHGKGILINEKPKIIEKSYDFRSFDECEHGEYWISYDGWFENDEKSGYGELLLSNNEKYVGEFKNDMVHGKGKFYKVDGTVFEGLWENNQLIQKY